MCVCVCVCVCVCEYLSLCVCVCVCVPLYPREELKSEYDSQLQQELEALRQRTHLEIEQLKMHTREVYERENRQAINHLKQA